MAKINPDFPHDMYKFIHAPIRDEDKSKGNLLVERFLQGPQTDWEDLQARIKTLDTLNDPTTIRADLLQFLKDIVGFTKELDNITSGLSENDLRKLITLAVALWKQKAIEPGYQNIVRLFTGKNSRLFNWFAFRLIVGEKQFGEDQIGDDTWLISVPGVEASDPGNTVVGLWTFEGNAKDRSLTGNDGSESGSHFYFNTPASGFPAGSDKYINFPGTPTGYVSAPNSIAYDFSADFTVELYFRTSSIGATEQTLWAKSDGTNLISINYTPSTNTFTFRVHDGTTNHTISVVPGSSMNDGLPHHVALVVDRANGIRGYVDGTESTALTAVGLLGDVTNSGFVYIGTLSPAVQQYIGDIDNVRLSTNAVYDVTLATITPPIAGFIEFIEEALDEFQTDIRIVDEEDGSLNKTLILRILNLMRPSSERINVIFVRFFDDFVDGIGQFSIVSGSAAVNTAQQMQLEASSVVATEVLNDTEFKDIVLQVKASDDDAAGGTFSILFFYQDASNFYEYRVNTATKILSVYKVVAGIPTQIGSDVSVDIVPEKQYFFTVSTSYNTTSSDTRIRTYLDRNNIHDIVDSEFEKGKFGMKTTAGTVMKIDEVEMLKLPVDVQRINPGFDL